MPATIPRVAAFSLNGQRDFPLIYWSFPGERIQNGSGGVGAWRFDEA